MSNFHKNGLILMLSAFLAAGALYAVPVSPNPNSLLAGKRVLVLAGASTSHATTRNAATAKLNLIKTALGAGFTMTFIDGSVSGVTLATLNNYDIVVFNYFFESQNAGTAFQSAFKSWLASGNKGWVGYHTSGANEAGEWNWFRDSVTSMLYQVHSGAAQNGTIRKTTDTAILSQPILQGLPASFTGLDEWYDFSYGLTWPDAKVIYYLDETTLGTAPQHPMNPHPMAWYRQDSRGTRYFYTGIIHDASGVNQSTDFFHSLVLRALEYVAGYSTATITSRGASIQKWNNLSYVTDSRELRVELADNYRLSVWSPNGEKLYSVKGNGRKTYSPEAFSKPGLYIVKLESKSAKLAQRVMIY